VQRQSSPEAEPERDETLSGANPSALSSPAAPEPVREPGGKSAESSVVRIETAKLEYLIDMVGELVIAESVVRNNPAMKASADPLLSRNLTQLARVVQEVQKTSMSMRMVAIGSLFRKMSRLTRDLARKSGKVLDLVTVGDDVELDRSIVEDLADPMVHMIRNAVDHGLELPEERLRTGKPEKGTVRLLAMHDAGDIVLELSDDGRGMDPARILRKARKQGLVGEQDNPDEESIFRLIFEAGFSTAEKVTDMSGRGVGMDVVRKQIQKLRGRIAIRSVLGKGCTFILRLPLTLAIIDGLVVGVGAQRFILPVFAVREMFSPKPGTFVTLENRAEAALFRDKLLPVVRLSRLFEAAAEDRKDGVLIVAEGRDQLYCIAVDQLIGKQEVVIKSLGKTFRDVPAISGGAILGDGRVGLIIDVNSLRYRN
jgi:two-component system chemotaxis sensor kinase CheA